MAKKESELFRDILVAASRIGARLFRNNVGMATKPARIRYGLGKGSSDAIGWTPVKIKPEHVGRTFAVFTAIETKGTKAKPTKEQMNFLQQVERAGGIAVVAYCVTDVINAIKRATG